MTRRRAAISEERRGCQGLAKKRDIQQQTDEIEIAEGMEKEN